MALSQDLQIQSQHQGGTAGSSGAVDEPADEVPVAHDVELEPEGRTGRSSYFLDGAYAHGRQGEGYAEPLGCPGGMNLTVGILHAGEPGGGERHGHAHFLAGHGGRQAAVFQIDSHALTQIDGLEALLIGPIGDFVPRAGIHIVVEHARHPFAMQPAQILDTGDDAHGRAAAQGQVWGMRWLSGLVQRP